MAGRYAALCVLLSANSTLAQENCSHGVTTTACTEAVAVDYPCRGLLVPAAEATTALSCLRADLPRERAAVAALTEQLAASEKKCSEVEQLFLTCRDSVADVRNSGTKLQKELDASRLLLEEARGDRWVWTLAGTATGAALSATLLLLFVSR